MMTYIHTWHTCIACWGTMVSAQGRRRGTTVSAQGVSLHTARRLLQNHLCARGSIIQDCVETCNLQLLFWEVEFFPFELVFNTVSFMLGHLITCFNRLGLQCHVVLQDVEKVSERCIIRQVTIDLGAKFSYELVWVRWSGSRYLSWLLIQFHPL